MTKKLHAEWIQWAKAYRLYDPKNPQETVAYAENMDTARSYAKKGGYIGISLCDADTMHVECY